MSQLGSARPGRALPGRVPDAASVRRMRSLARAELTLLLRSRSALWVALLMPLAMVAMSHSVLDQLDLSGTGLSGGEALLTGGVGTVLLVVVYLNLVPALVTRREERVLKRLRTGEITDTEILTGGALPTVLVAVAQCLVLVVAGSVLLDVALPGAPLVLLGGIVLAVVLLVLLAAVTAALTRTVDSAQITTTPLLTIFMLGCGIIVPLEVLPETLAQVCGLLPLTPSVELIRHGWLGGLDGAELTRAWVLALAWVVAGVFAVRRWFRWDPRQ